jgi:hypothetical protein
MKNNKWPDVATLNKHWLYFVVDSERIWIPIDQEPETNERKIIRLQK